MQFFVFGMYQSGCSVVSKILSHLGIYFSSNTLITTGVSALQNQLLKEMDCEWNRLLAYDANHLTTWLAERYKEDAQGAMAKLEPFRPWGVADTRLCLLLPFWRQFVSSPVCVHVVRNPIEIAQRLYLQQGVPLSVGVALWEYYTVAAITASQGLPTLYVNYRDLIENPRETVKDLIDKLVSIGIAPSDLPDVQAVMGVIDSEAYHERITIKVAEDYLNTPQRRLFRSLLTHRADLLTPVPTVSQGALDVLHGYEASIQIAQRVGEDEEELISLRKEVAELSKEVVHLRTLQAEKEETSVTLAEQNKLLTVNNSNQAMMLMELESRIEQLQAGGGQAASVNVQNELAMRMAEIEEARQEGANRIAMIQDLQQQVDRYQYEVELARDEGANRIVMIQDLQQQVDRYQYEIELARNEGADRIAMIQNLQGELELKGQELEIVRDNATKCMISNESLREELVKQIENAERLQVEVEQVRGDLLTAHQAQSARVDELTREVAQRNYQIEEARKESTERIEMIHALWRETDTLKTEALERHRQLEQALQRGKRAGIAVGAA